MQFYCEVAVLILTNLEAVIWENPVVVVCALVEMHPTVVTILWKCSGLGTIEETQECTLLLEGLYLVTGLRLLGIPQEELKEFAGEK